MSALPKLPTKANVWNGREMTHPESPPIPVDGYPQWVAVDCGCCHGLEWGGEEPRECRDCGASGRFFVHLPTGTGAVWPGGPFNGAKFDPDDCARYVAVPA